MFADHLIGRAGHAEQRGVDLGFPVAEARAGERAERAALITVGTAVGALVLELHGKVVLVAEHVERARHDAGRAAGARPLVTTSS